MTSRLSWMEQNEEVSKRFETAIALTKELDEALGDRVSLSEELKTLLNQQESWQEHRFEIVVVGEFSTGKSTFINAILQQEVLPSKVTPTTATINYIRHFDDGPGYEVAVVNYNDGRKEEVSFELLDEYVTEMSENVNVANEVHHVDLFIDSQYLKDGVIIVDTPGLQALHEEHEKITKDQIKKSHASIFLSNMEQLGKQTEFELLSDVKESIDRIFFIGNRLDGVPEEEVDQVITSFEDHLKDNPYCPIESEYARLYPISALQALKARDASVRTKHWNDYTPEQLLKESRFEAFEQKLEEYLFDGEKAQDALEAPKVALLSHYDRLEQKLQEIQDVLAGEVDLEQLESDQKRLQEEIELRKLQLQEQVRQIEREFDDVISENNQQFDRRYESLERNILETIESAITVEELREDIQMEWMDYYTSYERLIKSSTQTLIEQLNASFHEVIGNLDPVDSEVMTGSIEQREIVMKEREQNNVVEKVRESFEEEFSKQEKELKKYEREANEAKKEERRIRRRENEIKRRKAIEREDLRFEEELAYSIPQFKQEQQVVGKKFIFFDRKEVVEVSNEEYDKKMKELRQYRNDQRLKEMMLRAELENEKEEFDDMYSAVLTQEEIEERREALREQKREAMREKMQTESRRAERELKREKRRITSQLEYEMLDHKQLYRQKLRGLDVLQLAKKRIEQHVASADEQLAHRQRELDEKIELFEQSAEEQEKIMEILKKGYEKINGEKVRLI